MVSQKTIGPFKSVERNTHMNDSADPYMVYLGANIDNQKEIFWDTRLNPHAFATGKTGSGVSFFHRMIMSHTLKHQEDWNFVGIDPTKVELSDYQDMKMLCIPLLLKQMIFRKFCLTLSLI